MVPTFEVATTFLPAKKEASTQRKLTRPSLSYWEDAWYRLRRNRQAMASLAAILFLVFFTLAGSLIWNADPSAQELSRMSDAPSWKKPALVQADLEAWGPPTLPASAATASAGTSTGAPAPAPTSATELGAPSALRAVPPASTQAVRLEWSAVKGATGYAIYRNQLEPRDRNTIGVLLTEIEGGTQLGYEDRFDLSPKSYWYTVVAKTGGEESPAYMTLRLDLPVTLTLEAARALKPGAKVGDTLALPSHPLGTDYLGRDMLARLISGGRISLFIGFFAPLFATLLGVALGGVAGFFGGRLDAWIMRLTDFVLAVPFLLAMILFRVCFGGGAGQSGVMPMLVAMACLLWTSPARLTRGQIFQLKSQEFVQASRLLGAKPLYLLFRHLIPNTLGVILVSLTFAIPNAIFTEAFLSFIGMGVSPPTPSWGSMCQDGTQTFLTHPHTFIFPAIIISLTVLAFNLLGDGLRDALDPKLRSVS